MAKQFAASGTIMIERRDSAVVLTFGPFVDDYAAIAFFEQVTAGLLAGKLEVATIGMGPKGG